jgi:hypothetical protein
LSKISAQFFDAYTIEEDCNEVWAQIFSLLFFHFSNISMVALIDADVAKDDTVKAYNKRSGDHAEIFALSMRIASHDNLVITKMSTFGFNMTLCATSLTLCCTNKEEHAYLPRLIQTKILHWRNTAAYQIRFDTHRYTNKRV